MNELDQFDAWLMERAGKRQRYLDTCARIVSMSSEQCNTILVEAELREINIALAMVTQFRAGNPA